MENVVTLFNDVGGLQYKLWGDEWDVGVGHVKAVVSMPGDKNNTYYLNPSEYNKTSSMKGDTLTAETSSIPKGEFYELLLLMPLSDFDSDAPYAKHVDKNGREMIEKNLEDSIQSRAMWAMSFIALGLLSLLSPIIAVFVYLRYGREPDIAYEGIYERDLPTEDDLILKFEREDLKDLKRYERNLYNMLYSLSDGGVLNMSDLDSKLSSESSGKWFLGELDNFYESAKSEYLTEETVSRYFNDRGSDIMMFLAIGGIVMAAIMLFLGLITNLKAGIYVLAGGAFLLVFSIALLFLPDDIFGQWTPEGRVFYLKWKNFKKFLQDNSLIKEHAPDSIVVWKKYLIYGTALGIADKVYESMKLKIPDYADYDDSVLVYHYYGGYHLMHAAYDTGYSAANPSDSSGFGGIGGGSGGGGGGAF